MTAPIVAPQEVPFEQVPRSSPFGRSAAIEQQIVTESLQASVDRIAALAPRGAALTFVFTEEVDPSFRVEASTETKAKDKYRRMVRKAVKALGEHPLIDPDQIKVGYRFLIAQNEAGVYVGTGFHAFLYRQ